jgi:hypothetical protein
LGLALANQDQLDAGVAALRSSLAETERAYGRDSLESAERMQRLGDVLRRANQYDEAFALLSEGLEIRRRHMSHETLDIADSHNNLAILAVEMGKLKESDPIGATFNVYVLPRRRPARVAQAHDATERPGGH